MIRAKGRSFAFPVSLVTALACALPSHGYAQSGGAVSDTVNVKAGLRINPHLRVYAHATNLFDQQRFHVYGGSVIGRRVLAGTTMTF